MFGRKQKNRPFLISAVVGGPVAAGAATMSCPPVLEDRRRSKKPHSQLVGRGEPRKPDALSPPDRWALKNPQSQIDVVKRAICND